MATVEKEEKMNTSLEKSKYDDKENESKDLKSRDRNRDESKRSKKHKKRSHSSSSDSSRSRSREKSKSSRKHHRKHKSKRSRSRSSKRSKKRSRSPSKKHRSHRSRSKSKRSRSRSKKDSPKKDDKKKKDVPKDTKDRRKGFKFDSPPKDMQMAEASVDLSEFGIPNIEVLKEMYPQLKTMDPAELLQKLQLLGDMKNLRASKVDRKLYIGNIPPGLTPQMLMDLLNSALQKMNVNVDPPGNSIIGAWISPDNNYAFIDFRTPEEATNGFALNSVAIHGQTLKVGRPRSYQQNQETQNPLTALFGSTGLPITPLGAMGQGEGTMSTTLKIQTQTRILVLKNMVNISDLEIDEEYNEILEDVKEECAKHGKVLSISIPRAQVGQKDVPGLGKIFVEYSTVEEAKEARKELHGMTFDERTVEVSFYSEEKYAQKDFSEA